MQLRHFMRWPWLGSCWAETHTPDRSLYLELGYELGNRAETKDSTQLALHTASESKCRPRHLNESILGTLMARRISMIPSELFPKFTGYQLPER